MTRHAEEIERLAELLDESGAETDDARLAPLIALADTLRATETPRPDAARRAAMRATVLEGLEERSPGVVEELADGVQRGLESLRRGLRRAAAVAAAALLVGGSGAVLAAQEAVPGDVLYGVKQLTESVRRGLASGDLETGRLRLDLADRRLDELERVVGSASDEEFDGLVGDHRDDAVGGAELLLQVADATDDPPIVTEVRGWWSEQDAALQSLEAAVPAERARALAAVRGTLDEVATRIDAAAAAIGDAAPSPPDTPARPGDPTPRPTTPGDAVPQPPPADPATPPGRPGQPGAPAGGAGDGAGDVVDDVRGRVDDATGEVRDRVDDVTGDVGGTAGDAATDVGGAAEDAGRSVTPPTSGGVGP